MSEEGLERQAIDYFALVAARDAAGMERFWGPAPVWEMLALGATLGPSEARAFFGGLFAAIPDLETTVERVTTGAQTTAIQWRMAGTFEGAPFQGIKATGRRIELRGCDCIEWEAGQLVQNTVYYDGLGFARDVGMLPPHDSLAERGMYGAFNALTTVRRRLLRH